MHIYETLPNGIKIVEYEPSLNATLADMWNKSKDDWGGGNETKTPGQVATRIESSSCIHHYVALDGDVAVGYCSLGRYFGDANALYIELLGVRPDYQGKKVGKALTLRCVNRTIELGYPRVDIHTWPGNTAAMPLYKKCGYLWEDRADSTHLVNFIPEILGTELFKPFFEKTDWYADSTRSWEIVPDGVKVNRFEVFGYSWEKDGETLAVGYERTGRRMRFIETKDYKIEMMAENHELAFGLSYNCTFSVTNKTGKDLRVKINGREDANIRLDFTLDTQVTGTQVFPAQFYVGEVAEVQDKWQVHPCVLADVEINGQTVALGMGINPKFPLDVRFPMDNAGKVEGAVMQVGMKAKFHINVASALLQNASVTFTLPESDKIAFKQNYFNVQVNAEGKTSIPIEAKILDAGYDAMPIKYDIMLADGSQFSFTKPFHAAIQTLFSTFHFETEYGYNIVNGPWKIILYKSENELSIRHLTNPDFNRGDLFPPKLGKPYDDEFNLIKPTVTCFQRGRDMVMEAEFVSEKFAGMVATMVISLSAIGIISRHYRVENRGSTPRALHLNDSGWLELGGFTTFRANGQFMQNHAFPLPDGEQDGMGDIDSESVEENWIFEANPTGGCGVCWGAGLQPKFQWGSMVIFEHDLTQLAPNQIIETPPLVLAFGLFNDFGSFRNFAMQITDKENYVPAPPVEVRINGYNPVISTPEIALDIINNRETTLEGEIRVASPLFETQVQVNEERDGDEEDDDDENDIKQNYFNLPIHNPQPLVQIKVDMRLSVYDKGYKRVLFAPKGDIKNTQEGTIYSVANGEITFRVDPTYGAVCYSLTTADGAEWLKHQHPERKPFAWYNPFLGGIRLLPPKMNNVSVLKEDISAEFATVKDNYGNMWHGICLRIAIKEEAELRGAVYETYYVTLPGVPVLCAFYRFINGTGAYRCDTPEFDAFPNPTDEGKNFHVEIADKHGQQSRLRFGEGAGDMDPPFVNTAKVISERPQRLYLFHGNKNNGKHNELGGDTKVPLVADFYMEAAAAHGETFTSSPVFYLVTEEDLPNGALDDLERVKF